MKRLKDLNRGGRLFVVCAVFGLLFACARQLENFEPDDVIEGEPSMISLQIAIPGMTAVSRVAGLDPNDSKTVDNVWVGIYNVRTGERTNTTGDNKDFFSVKINSSHSWQELNLEAKSGLSYIVAVGNVGNYNGIDIETGSRTNLLTLLREADSWEKYKRIASIMSDPQAIQRTNDSFLMSGIYLGGDKDNHAAGASYSDWLDGHTFEPVPVAIPPSVFGGRVTLNGKVHLRRLVSYVKFKIIPATNITFTPVSWQIRNLPGVSFVHERHDEDPIVVNAADAMINNLPPGFGGQAYHESLLYESSTFIEEWSGTGTNATPTGSYSFDFYQLENKHKGLPLSGFSDEEITSPYHYRELEFKTIGETSGIPTQNNTGWYRSLITPEAFGKTSGTAAPSTAPDLCNNNATFVEITGRVEYYYRTDAAGRQNGASDGELTYAPIEYPHASFNVDGNIYDENNLPDYVVRRVALATYTIHLGYCEGYPEEDKMARDFNCRRNTQYTYNVKINGVDKIRVEAVADNDSPDEQYPGVEGTVTDVIGQPINLDSHYGIFNIKMSDEDRMNMIWRIRAPFGDELIDMIYDSKGFLTSDNSSVYNLHENRAMYDALPLNQFYNWLQIRPTTGENVLAHYPGDPRLIGRKIRNDDSQTGGTYYSLEHIYPYALNANEPGAWFLDHLCRPGDFPHPSAPSSSNYVAYLKNTDDSKKESLYNALSDSEKNELTKGRYYTVFVDEYVYEYEYAPGKNTLTQTYPNRYENGIEQSGTMDIQEWRNFVNRDDRRAWIALRDNSVNTNSSSLNISPDLESVYFNALYLISQESIQTYYSNSAPRGIGIESTNESYVEWERSYVRDEPLDNPTWPWMWSEYLGASYWNGRNWVQFSEYDEVDGLKNQYMYVRKNNDRDNWWDVMSMEASDFNAYLNASMTPRKNNEGKAYYIPDHIHEYMAACLARNRDLNNDGVIGANEIRWYLPTSATLSRIVLGGPSLRSPLFNLSNYPEDYMKGGSGMGYSHYMGSDKKFIWAEEFTSELTLGSSGGYKLPSNIRCIRNLGQHMNLSPDDAADGYDTIDAAYKLEGQTVVLNYYRTAALRDYEPSFIPAHDVGSALATASRSFKFASADVNGNNTPVLNEIYYQNFYNSDYAQIRDGVFPRSFFYDASDNNYAAWFESLATNEICGSYSEEWNGSDRGTWRVPNINEVAILYLLKILPVNYNYSYPSCSYEHFKRLTVPADYPKDKAYHYSDFFGLKFNGGLSISATAIRQGANIHIRCVKDVQQ